MKGCSVEKIIQDNIDDEGAKNNKRLKQDRDYLDEGIGVCIINRGSFYVIENQQINNQIG